MKKILSIALVLIVILSVVGCSRDEQAGETAEKEVLTIQFVPTNNDGSMEAKAKPFADYLSEKLDMPVEVTLATDYSTIVEAMASKKVDLGIMPPAAYVQAMEQGAAQALLSSQLGAFNRETGLPEKDQYRNSFKGEILVKADSEIQTLVDLKGKKIATLSPNSASGYIYPIAEMKDQGIDPTKDSVITVVNDIPSEMTAVLTGQQDACFVFEGARVVFNDKFSDYDLMKELRVLYLTEGEIPNDAIAVQPEMSQELKDKIKEVFVNMPNDEQGLEAMSLWNHKSYEEPNNEAYDTIKDYIEKAAE